MDAKETFKEFCKDKIEDLGKFENYNILLKQDIRDFGYSSIIYDENNDLNYIIDGANNMHDMNMIDHIELISRYEFDKISQSAYDDILSNWNDYNMDQYFENEYSIEIKETLSTIVNIKAASLEEAILEAKDRYNNEEILLDEQNFVGVNIDKYDEENIMSRNMHYEQKLIGLIALNDGINMDHVDFILKSDCDFLQMKEAINAFKVGLSLDEIKTFYKDSINNYQMNKAVECFQKGFSIEQVSVLTKSKFTNEQFDNGVNALKSGLDINQLEFIMKPEHSALNISVATNCFLDEFTYDEVKTICNPSYSLNDMFNIIDDILEAKKLQNVNDKFSLNGLAKKQVEVDKQRSVASLDNKNLKKDNLEI